eukprot:6174664-Pleurochrysis_carterae.AAC.2
MQRQLQCSSDRLWCLTALSLLLVQAMTVRLCGPAQSVQYLNFVDPAARYASCELVAAVPCSCLSSLFVWTASLLRRLCNLMVPCCHASRSLIHPWFQGDVRSRRTNILFALLRAPSPKL